MYVIQKSNHSCVIIIWDGISNVCGGWLYFVYQSFEYEEKTMITKTKRHTKTLNVVVKRGVSSHIASIVCMRILQSSRSKQHFVSHEVFAFVEYGSNGCCNNFDLFGIHGYGSNKSFCF